MKSEMEDVKSFGLGLVNVDRVVDEPAKVYKEKGRHDYSSAGNEETLNLCNIAISNCLMQTG